MYFLVFLVTFMAGAGKASYSGVLVVEVQSPVFFPTLPALEELAHICPVDCVKLHRFPVAFPVIPAYWQRLESGHVSCLACVAVYKECPRVRPRPLPLLQYLLAGDLGPPSLQHVLSRA